MQTHTLCVRKTRLACVCTHTVPQCVHTHCVRACARACSNNGCVAPDAGQRTTNQSNICSPHISITQHAFDRSATSLRLDYLSHVVLLSAPGLPHSCARASITSLGTCLCWPGFMRAGLCGPRTNMSATPTTLRCALLLCSHSALSVLTGAGGRGMGRQTCSASHSHSFEQRRKSSVGRPRTYLRACLPWYRDWLGVSLVLRRALIQPILKRSVLLKQAQALDAVIDVMQLTDLDEDGRVHRNLSRML